MIENKRFKEQPTEALQNNDIANNETVFEIKLCRHVNEKLEKLKVTLSEVSCTTKLRLLYIMF